MLSSSPHSCVTPRGHMGRKRGCRRTVHSMPPLDKENLSPRRYTDNCHHNFMGFLQQKSCNEINSRSRSEPCQASKGSGSSKDVQGGKSKLRSLEINVPNCLHFTTHSGKGERGKKKAKNKAEEIAPWRPYQDGSGRELVP